MSAESPICNKRKRLRFGRACNNCRKKKNKCDGVRPTCSGCRSRGLLCEYVNAEIDTSFMGYFHNSVEMVDPCPRPPSVSRQSVSNLGGNFLGHGDEANSPHSLPAGNVGTAGSLQTDDQADAPLAVDSPAQDGPKKAATTTSSYFGDSSSIEFVFNIRGGSHTPKSKLLSFCAPTHHRDSVVSHASTSPTIVSDDGTYQYSFPPRDHANRLVDAYFERVHVLYPFLHEGSFRARYEQFWATNGDPNTTDAPWLALLNLVFASGSEFTYPDSHDDLSKGVAPYIQCAKRIILSHGFGNADLHLLQALLILCHFLQGTLELDECWNFVGLMIRNAMSIGLHINPADNGHTRPVDRESRKRVWWGCVVLDRTLSMKLGRPPSINLEDAYAVDLPLEVDDQYFSESTTIPRQPSGRLPRMSFFNQTIRLSYIIDQILSTLYSHRPKRQGDNALTRNRTEEASVLGNVVLLDGQLQAWWNDLPLQLRQEPDYSDDVDFRRQRTVLRIRFLAIRLLLQRPAFLLLVNKKCREEYTKSLALVSCNICVSASQETIRLVESNYPRQMLNSLWYNLHYIFTAIGVLAMVQTMEPALRSLSAPVDPVVIDRGMQFLRSACCHSVLAARYVALLERVKDQSAGENDVSMSTGLEKEAGAPGANNANVYAEQNGAPPMVEQGLLHPDFQPFRRRDENDFGGLEPSDPLFWFGMPQNFLTPEWG